LETTNYKLKNKNIKYILLNIYQKKHKRMGVLILSLFTIVCASTTSLWTVQLAPGTDAAAYAAEHGFHYAGKISFLDGNWHKFTDINNGNKRTVRDVRLLPHVLQANEEVERFQYKRIADPNYEQQWHLHTHGSSVDADLGPTNITGSGIRIAVVDDGVQHEHPDLKANYDPINSYDFNDNDMDPSPTLAVDGHGTAASGVAAAVKENGHCGRGVSPGAKLVGLRLIARPVTDLTEAQALTHNAIGAIDIYSCSWGPEDSGTNMVEPGPLVQAALQQYAGQMRGRLGKGSIYVWASGNGNGNGDSCAFDGYASSPFVNAIGALDHTGKQAWYSEGCSALMAVTPSSGNMQGITTVDLMGSAGYDPGECTSNFGGTSSAAPLAAGIIALMLQQRPDLTWRDVKHVIAKGSVPVDTAHPGWIMNGGGYRHSYQYGFGLMKVPSILLAAQEHKLVPSPMKTYHSHLVTFDSRVGSIPFAFNHTVAESGIRFIEHVILYVGISHEMRGHITLKLISPHGTESVLATERPLDVTFNYPQRYACCVYLFCLNCFV
jgi:hypothetical protein